MILSAFKKVNVYLPKFEYTCTQNLARDLDKAQTLSALCVLYGIEYENKHDALDDAKAALMVWMGLRGMEAAQ